MARVSGGDKLGAALAAIADRMKGDVKVGFLEGATYPDTGLSVAQVAFWNEFGTSRSPSRPFFRHMIAEQSPGWGVMAGKAAKFYQYNGTQVLQLMGEKISEQLQQSIVGWKEPPNAQSTIENKGFDKPLIHTGHMQNSIGYEVSE